MTAFTQREGKSYGCSGVLPYGASPCTEGSVADDMKTLDLDVSVPHALQVVRESFNMG